MPDKKDLITAQSIFAYREAEFGQPGAPTKKGFVALAQAGKEVWNAWRIKWPEPIPNFEDVDFSGSDISFSGFDFRVHPSAKDVGVNFARAVFSKTSFIGAQFGHFAHFGDAEFTNSVSFESAQFGDRTCFNRVKFRKDASFDKAHFGQKATFDFACFEANGLFRNTAFGSNASFWAVEFRLDASFTGAEFGETANFIAAQFLLGANFDCAQFGDSARFEYVQLSGDASFVGAQFGQVCFFDGIKVGSRANFDGAQFKHVTFEGAQFGNDASFVSMDRERVQTLWKSVCFHGNGYNRRISRAEEYGMDSTVFNSISFSGARFAGRADFRNRNFAGKTDFGSLRRSSRSDASTEIGEQTIFEGVPEFHGCKLHQDTSFEGALFLAPATSETSRAYRTLKLAMAQQQATREEQRFFRLEMMAEGASATRIRRILFKLYEIISDYGFSLTRPIILWLCCIGIFGLAHGALTGPSALQTGIDWQRTAQWAQYVLFNAIPLLGFDKAQLDLRTQLFDQNDSITLVIIMLDMLHKTCALIALFLIGLALRNLFKMKG